MNLPKFIKDDERLFRLLLSDLFPSLELPVPEYGALQVKSDLTKEALIRRRLNFFFWPKYIISAILKKTIGLLTPFSLKCLSYYGGPYLTGPMVYIKTYIFNHFY